LLVVDAQNVTVFDTQSLRRLRSLAITPRVAAPAAAVISPDGRKVAIGSNTGAVSFIDAATGDGRLGIGPRPGAVVNLAYASDGRSVASASNNKVIIWNPRSPRPERS
jgi:WD40 repeat protein